MKPIFLTAALILLCVSVQAQQTRTDDALLLDYYQSGRYTDASAFLKKLYPEPVNDVKKLARLAYTAQMSNNLPEAQSYYERVYALDSTNQAALFSIGNINLRRGNDGKAELFFKRILLRDTTNILVYSKLAGIAAGKKDSANAIMYLQKASRLNPADIDVAVDLSSLYIAQKKFDQALSLLNKAAEADPDNIYILENMVNLFSKEKRWVETVATARRMITLNEAGTQILYKLGVAYFNLKNYECGAATFADIPVLDQTEYSYYFAGMCFKNLKDNKRAAELLNLAIAQGISPNIASYYGELADISEGQSNYKKAILAYQKGLQFSTQPTIYVALAELYESKLHDKITAAKYYKLAATAYQTQLISNDNPVNLYLLANIYDVRLKDTANAIKYYRKCLDTRSPAALKYIMYSKSRIDQLQNKL